MSLRLRPPPTRLPTPRRAVACIGARRFREWDTAHGAHTLAGLAGALSLIGREDGVRVATAWNVDRPGCQPVAGVVGGQAEELPPSPHSTQRASQRASSCWTRSPTVQDLACSPQAQTPSRAATDRAAGHASGRVTVCTSLGAPNSLPPSDLTGIGIAGTRTPGLARHRHTAGAARGS
jgi:hypothetical protein